MFCIPEVSNYWSLDEVSYWLYSIGLNKHINIFRDNSIDGNVLLNNLTIDRLRNELNINDLTNINILKKEINKLKILQIKINDNIDNNNININIMKTSKNAQNIALEYNYYRYEGNTNTSLTKTSILWLIITLFLVIICSIPLCIIILIILLLIFYFWLKIFKFYIIYILSLTILPLLYILHIFNIYKIRIFAFYSIFPLFIAIVFRDCILFALEIRENIIFILKLNNSNNNNCILKYNIKLLSLLNLRKYLIKFAIKYNIFGPALHAYKSFGSIIKLQNYFNDHIILNKIEFKYLLKKCWKEFGEKDIHFTFKKCWKSYNISEKIMVLLMFISYLMYIILPSLYYIKFKLIENNNIYKNNKNIKLFIDIIQFLFGILLNIITGYSIGIYTEVIFYPLYKYNYFMKVLGKLLIIL